MEHLLKVSGENWQQMFGENPEPGSMRYTRWIAYVLSTFLLNIVGLNLLISVITDNYTKVTSKLSAIDQKSRLEQILKVEKSLQRVQP